MLEHDPDSDLGAELNGKHLCKKLGKQLFIIWELRIVLPMEQTRCSMEGLLAL